MVQSLTNETENTLLISTFLVAQATFGVDANNVQEVIQVKQTTIVHHSPHYLVGVMNLRGRIITIIDLGEKLNLGPIERNEHNRIMIVDSQQEYIGLLVEEIKEVVQTDYSKIVQPPENVHGVQAQVITGVFQIDQQRIVALLDIDKIVNIEDQNNQELSIK